MTAPTPLLGHYDVIVVGAGHNGLIAAGLLAKEGLSVLVCEAREIVGGAAVSEHPFGPDYTVTSLSYVVSLLPPSIVDALHLTRHGYHVYPQGPYFAPRRDGRYLALPDDPARAARRSGSSRPPTPTPTSGGRRRWAASARSWVRCSATSRPGSARAGRATCRRRR